MSGGDWKNFTNDVKCEVEEEHVCVAELSPIWFYAVVTLCGLIISLRKRLGELEGPDELNTDTILDYWDYVLEPIIRQSWLVDTGKVSDSRPIVMMMRGLDDDTVH